MSSDGHAAARTASAITVPAAPESVGRVRRALRATLDSAGIAQDTVDTALLLTSELVTNAVLHARTDVQVTVVVEEGIRVEVHDQSGMLPATRSHAVDSMTGRGLHIVGLLADDYGVEVADPSETGRRNGGGKTVWFCLARSSTQAHEPSADHFPDLVPTSGPTITVEWRGLPVLLFDVVMEHNEALMREFALEQLGDLDPTEDLGVPLAAAAAARARLAQAVASYRPLDRTRRHIDVILQLEPSDVDALADLLPVLREAELLSAAGGILTQPALPELLRLREWCVTEIMRQAGGAVPTPWRTPYVDDRVPVEMMSGSVRAAADHIRKSAEPLLLARPDVILAASPSAAQLLGWEADDLVGRRITVIVPPELRDVHLAGITRHLMTGQTTMLGVEAPISAWHRKGYPVPGRLLLERWPGVRALFVARFGPAD